MNEIRALQLELEGVNASHDDEEAAHQNTLRVLKKSQEQIAELKDLTDRQIARTGKLTGEVDKYLKQIAGLQEQVKELEREQKVLFGVINNV